VTAVGVRRRASLAALLICAAGVAHADWKRDYEFGQQAFDKGNWSEAEKLMRSAQSEEPGAAVRKRFQGTQFQLYAPAHFAAVAAYKQGACSRALDYLNDASTRDVTAQVPALAAEQQEVERACNGQVAATPVETPHTTTPTPPVVKPPTTAVDTRTASTDNQRPAPTTATHPVAPVPSPPAPPVAPPAPANAAAPAALRAGISAFLAGDYNAAIRVNDAAIADGRSRALLLLVRAAAGFTQAELKGGDAAMIARAETDVRMSRRLARIEPDPTLFSPKVRAHIARIR
jgi:hypothetical protein